MNAYCTCKLVMHPPLGTVLLRALTICGNWGEAVHTGTILGPLAGRALARYALETADGVVHSLGRARDR